MADKINTNSTIDPFLNEFQGNIDSLIQENIQLKQENAKLKTILEATQAVVDETILGV